jgi:hypothetical protein
MSEPSTAAGAFEPNWDEIYEAWLQPEDDEYNRTYALPIVIAEYQRQAAAAGLVMVRQDFLAQTKEMVDWLMGTCTAMGSDQAVYDELVALAATPPPAPGGDAR